MWQLKSRKILPSVADSNQLKVSLVLIIGVAEVARQNRRRGKRYEQGSREEMEVGGLSSNTLTMEVFCPAPPSTGFIYSIAAKQQLCIEAASDKDLSLWCHEKHTPHSCVEG